MSQALATAEWADPETFAKEHAFEAGKFWLGRSPINGQPIGYADDRHVCLVSGTRAGKGTTTIIPNLCLWPGSVVVVDPKGENATVTAARRGPGGEHCKGMGQSVHVLDPFRVAQVDDSLRSHFNPLDVLDPNDPRTIDDAGCLADAIVVANPESKDPFWDQSARSLVKGLILHVLTEPMFEGRRNLITVRQLIARGDHEGVTILQELGETEIAPPQVLLWQTVSQNQAFNGVVAGIGENMANMAANSAKQFESVLQVANRNTEFLDSPGMAECLATSDFSLADIKTDPKGVSVYLSLPQRYMGEHFRWLRMMITLILNEMEAVPEQPATGHRVLMCLDEFAGLKRMEVIENAVAQIAGFGVKLFFVLQSLEQLKATYKDNWQTFLSNAGLKLFFGLDDHFSRKYVSDFIGDTELMRELETASSTTNKQTTQNTGTTSSASWNTQESSGINTGISDANNWKAMPFFLRNTAGLFAAIVGNRQSTSGRSSGKHQSTGSSEGGSDSAQESTATATGSGQSTGQNQSLFKRPLVTPDEVGRYFGRIDDPDDLICPGLGLTVLTGTNPSSVQRVNYFDDPYFRNHFNAHPDHPMPEVSDISVWLPPSNVISYIAPSVHTVEGTLLVNTGARVKKGAPLLAFTFYGGRWAGEELPETLVLKSPATGIVVDFSEDGGAIPMSGPHDVGQFTAYKSNAEYHGTFKLLIQAKAVDSTVEKENQQAVAVHCKEENRLAERDSRSERQRVSTVTFCIVAGLVVLFFVLPLRLAVVVCIVLGAIGGYVIKEMHWMASRWKRKLDRFPRSFVESSILD